MALPCGMYFIVYICMNQQSKVMKTGELAYEKP